jgi:uncharacterized membrane protein
MSYKTYMVFRLVFIAIIAGLSAWGATVGNLIFLIPVVIVLIAVLYAMRRKVNEVVIDERVNTIAYRATRLAYLAFVVIAVLVGITLANRAVDASDIRFSIGLTLDYSACVLVVFYWLGYIYYNRKLGGKE